MTNPDCEIINALHQIKENTFPGFDSDNLPRDREEYVVPGPPPLGLDRLIRRLMYRKGVARMMVRPLEVKEGP